jgi:hypothetical protein
MMAATVGVLSYAPSPSDAAEASTTHSAHRSNKADKGSRQAVTFRNKMRQLWEDHIVWTRQFIVCSVAELPDANAAAGRLLANQDHIGDAIKPYYGEEPGHLEWTLAEAVARLNADWNADVAAYDRIHHDICTWPTC